MKAQITRKPQATLWKPLAMFSLPSVGPMVNSSMISIGATATAVMGGEATTAFNTLETVLALIHAKRLRALAVSTRERAPALPDVPTAIEAGFREYEAIGWFGLMAPAGTPPAVVGQMSAEVAKAMKTPAIRERTTEQGATPIGSSPAEFERFVRDEIAKWTRIIREAGIKLD